MSINSLTNEVLSQESDLPAVAELGGLAVPGDSSAEQNRVNDALDTLTKYLPVETITLYIAAVSVTPSLETVSGNPEIGKVIYWIFAVLTPLILVLVLISKRASMGLPTVPPRWPWWKMVAATIAFLIWALAVPNNPYVATEAAAIAAGFGAVFVSTILSLFDPIFNRQQ